jgi:hypothetical protein
MKQNKRKTKQNYPGFEFKPRQVNDSSQSSQGTAHLVSQVENSPAEEKAARQAAEQSLQ